jgi:hydrogenase maturation protease
MIRIVGLGSPFGDDRVGWRVVELLEGRLSQEIELVALDRPGAALINWMQEIDHLILVDAVSSGAPPGTLIKIDPAQLETSGGRLTSHDLALAATLRLAASLGCLPARTDIYGVEISGHTGEALSGVAESAAAELASVVADAVS